MACCSIIIRELTDGPPLQNIGGPGPPGLMYTVCRNGADASDRIHYPVNVSCRRDSLSVNDSGSHSHDSGTPFEASFVNFCVTKFRQNSDNISKLMACTKFWTHVIRAPFQPGALRTCVPCLMVNPALSKPYANVWTRAFWRVLEILRILCELGSRA